MEKSHHLIKINNIMEDGLGSFFWVQGNCATTPQNQFSDAHSLCIVALCCYWVHLDFECLWDYKSKWNKILCTFLVDITYLEKQLNLKFLKLTLAPKFLQYLLLGLGVINYRMTLQKRWSIGWPFLSIFRIIRLWVKLFII